jgi:hypothetical protein
LVWQPTDLLKAGNLTVRQGDSLLLAAGSRSGSTFASAGTSEHLRIEVAGTALYDGAPKPVPCRFDQPGTVPVTVIFRDAQAVSHKRTVPVKVVGSAFAGSPAAWTGRERMWDCPNLAAEAVLDHDAKTQLTADSTANQTGRRFRLKVTEGEDRWVVARLGQGGPILASALIRGIDILGVSESGAFYGEKYADGSCLVETAVAQSRVFPDVTVPVEIVVGGVMFEDGTLLKTLQARDFDETGLAILHFIMPPGTQTSNCHVMKAFHTQVYLGEY